MIYQTNAQKYSNKILLKTVQNKNKDSVLVATKFKSLEEQEEIERKLHEEDLTVLDDYIGFTKILRIVVDSVSKTLLIN